MEEKDAERGGGVLRENKAADGGGNTLLLRAFFSLVLRKLVSSISLKAEKIMW